MDMTRYSLATIMQAPDGDYWLRTKATERWLPCLLRNEICGMETHISFRSPYWGEYTYWPEDPDCGDFSPSDSLELLGPIPQPELPDPNYRGYEQETPR